MTDKPFGAARKGPNSAPTIRPSSSGLPPRKTSAPVGLPPIRKTSAPFKKPTANSGLSAVFSGLNLESDEADSSSKVPEQMLKQARKSGQLNLSNRGLTSVPSKVWSIHEQPKKKTGFSIDKVEEDDAWWENVELTKLILASNQLTQIPADIQNLNGLTVLDLHDNSLESLPDEIGQLENLAKLNLNHNQIAKFPPGIFRLRNLRSLMCCHNQLVELDQDLGELYDLEQLDIAHNQMRELPSSIGYLTKLVRLDVSHNNLSSLPPQMGALRLLAYFDASNNNIKNVADTLQNMARLEQVYLHHNQINEMPKIRECPNLKELHLAFNRVKELTDEDVENMPSLKLLDLKENKIQNLPDSFINLQMLERFDVSNNDLSGLPPALGTMTNLKSFLVDGNPMKTIRRDILQRGTHELMKYLRSRIDSTELERLQKQGNVSPTSSTPFGMSPPVPDKFTMRNAQMLNMSKKEIRILPQEAVDNAIEANVTGVDLSKNHFGEFPQILEPLLPQLHQIDISFNRLESLPSLIGLASKLQYINLSNNKLKELPDELAKLPHLREVCISFNRFESVPRCIYECPKLEILVAASNQILAMDVDGLSKLTRITVLDLQNNNIDYVPPMLGRLAQIRSLQLEGNPFRVPRAQILVKGTESIMMYLRDRIPKDD